MTFSTNNSNERTPIADLQERVWLACFRKGDMAAFERIVNTHQQSIFSYLKRCQFSQQECEQLFQEILLEIYSSAESYSLSKPLLPWIFQIVVNVVRRFLHGEKIAFFPPVENIPVLHAFKSQSSLRELEIQQLKFARWLNAVLFDLLPAIQIEILLLTTVHELDLEDIAQILNIPRHKTIASLQQARQTILSHWSDYDPEPVMKKMDYV